MKEKIEETLSSLKTIKENVTKFAEDNSVKVLSNSFTLRVLSVYSKEESAISPLENPLNGESYTYRVPDVFGSEPSNV